MNLSKTIKWRNIHIVGVPKGEKTGKRTEKLFEEIISKK